MNFVNAVTICFQKYVDFSGRATRSEFWLFTLFVTLLVLSAEFLDSSITNTPNTTFLASYGPAASIIFFLTALPSISVTARRLHDVGYSGWWQLVAFTGIGLIPLLYIWCKPSDREANSHGDSPIGIYGEQVSALAPTLVRLGVLPLIIGFVAWLTYFIFVVMDGEQMGVKVYSGSELTEEHLYSLKQVGLIIDSDEIQYFYSDELGKVIESGQFITLNRVVSFMTNDEGDLDTFEMSLDEIERVEEVRASDEWTDGEYRIIGNDEAEYEYIIVLLPTDANGKQKFIDALNGA